MPSSSFSKLRSTCSTNWLSSPRSWNRYSTMHQLHALLISASTRLLLLSQLAMLFASLLRANVQSASSTWNPTRRSCGARPLAVRTSTRTVSSSGGAARWAGECLVSIVALSGRMKGLSWPVHWKGSRRVLRSLARTRISGIFPYIRSQNSRRLVVALDCVGVGEHEASEPFHYCWGGKIEGWFALLAS